jgi:hypothetical protein
MIPQIPSESLLSWLGLDSLILCAGSGGAKNSSAALWTGPSTFRKVGVSIKREALWYQRVVALRPGLLSRFGLHFFRLNLWGFRPLARRKGSVQLYDLDYSAVVYTRPHPAVVTMLSRLATGNDRASSLR